jgi:chromosome segregation ATPase
MSVHKKTKNQARREANNRKLQELKKELRRAKRAINELRKNLNEADVPDAEEDVRPKEKKEDKAQCPKCKSSELLSFITPSGKTVLSCSSCKKWRSTPS